MVSFAIKHLVATSRVLAFRAIGAAHGRLKPVRLYFELRTSYQISEENGSAATTVDVLFPSGTYAALDYTPVWAHHRFYGWYTTATTPQAAEVTTGVQVQPGGSIVHGRQTIFARWQTPATVTFDATSGGGEMPGGWTAPDYYEGQPYGELPTPSKSDEIFIGWYTAGGARVTTATTVPAGGGALTARYMAVTYATKFEVTTTSSYKKFGIYSTTAINSANPTVVDWGDGSVDVVIGSISQLAHEYASAGTFEVGISDTISAFAISSSNSTWYGTTAQVRYTLKKVKAVSASVTSLSSYCYYYCAALTNAVFPSSNSFTLIPDSCFYYCQALQNVTIPATVTSIGNYAFYYCNGSGFNTITIPAGVTNIGSYAFYYCYYLTSITFEAADAALTLNNYAFAYCGYYSVFDLDMSPRKVSAIPQYCFYYSRYLRNFTFPQNCTAVNGNAFRYAFSLSNVGSPTVTIPEGVTSIGTYAFANASYLAAVVIPSTCSTIGTYAFYSATRLATITVNRSAAPSVQSSTFGNSNSYYTGRTYYSAGTNKLIVPAGATGYTSSYWLDPLCSSTKCGFTLQEAS
ncbi:MAG: leucine-rich repeat protein [Kiritimatiellae bacterium]|nr:leucine-rich repeat protein [Kiritimatiellia bacterium]